MTDTFIFTEEDMENLRKKMYNLTPVSNPVIYMSPKKFKDLVESKVFEEHDGTLVMADGSRIKPSE